MNPAAADVSVVVLSWNTRELLAACLASVLRRDHGLALEVIVVDNASADGSADLVERDFAEAVLLRNARNEGYARGNNQGIARATAPYVLLLNSDAELRGDALEQLVGFLDRHPDHGGVAPRLVGSDGAVQRACMRFPTLAAGFLHDSLFERVCGRPGPVRRYFMEDFDHLSSRDVDQPPGACLLLRRDLVQELGGFDERLWLFFNDVDLCWRIARTGRRIRYLAEAPVLHHGGASTSTFPDFVGEWNRNRLLYYRKHHGRAGSLMVKTAVLLRGLEEAIQVLLRRPEGEIRPALGEIRRIVVQTLRA